MTAYVASDHLPVVLCFDDVTPADISPILSKALRDGSTLSIITTDADPGEAIHMLISLRHVPLVGITEENPGLDDKPTIHLANTDLATLLT